MTKSVDKPRENVENPMRAVSPFQALQDEMERMIHAFSRPEMDWRSGLLKNDGSLGLRINVGETDSGIQITADLPGVRESDIDVTLENDVLRIKAEKSADHEEKEQKWHVVERSFGRYERAIQVPKGIDPDAVKAEFKDGVLSISLPKPLDIESKARKISVSRG